MGGSVDEWLACWTQAKKGNSLRQTVETCQGPEMKMCETVHHSEEGAIFFAGEHCL